MLPEEMKRRIRTLEMLSTQAPEGVVDAPDEPEVVAPSSRMPLVPPAPMHSGFTANATHMPDSPVAGIRDDELEDAKSLDQRTEADRLFEAATRQLIGGLTRTAPQGLLTQPVNAEKSLLGKRQQARMEALKQLEMDNDASRYAAGQERQAMLDARRETDRAEDLKQRALSNELRGKDIAARERNTNVMQGLAFGAAGRAAAAEERAAKAEVPKAAAELRKEFNALPDVKTFGEVDAAYQKVKAAASSPSAAGDLSAIFAYMKMLDPGSSVREGEFANAQNAGGIDAKITAAYNNVLNGQRLTPEQRADFIKQAENLYGVHKQRRDAQAKRYGDLASKQGLAPEDVTGVGVAPVAGGRVIVSNGTQTLEIDASDLADAERDGFKRVK
jgi:hypothetical protein